MSKTMKILTAAISPLKSRKTRVALATVIAAYLAKYELGVSEELILTILGTGTALILAIAHEDNGAKSAAPGPQAAAKPSGRPKSRA